MKMPPANSNQFKIVKLLLNGASITPQEGVGLHGTMRMTLAEISMLYWDLVVRGCAVQVGPRISASPALLAKYGLYEEIPAAPGEKAPSRSVPPFKPLSRQNIASSRGRREGSNDMRAVPSHYARLGTNTGGM